MIKHQILSMMSFIIHGIHLDVSSAAAPDWQAGAKSENDVFEPRLDGK